MALHQESGDKEPDEGSIMVVGKTPAGFENKFAIKRDWTIQKVIEEMVKRFEAEGKLQAGTYNLVLAQPEGKPTQLVASQRVSDYPIDEKDELDLIVGEPEKDG